jgi:hypothetical protein
MIAKGRINSYNLSEKWKHDQCRHHDNMQYDYSVVSILSSVLWDYNRTAEEVKNLYMCYNL